MIVMMIKVSANKIGSLIQKIINLKTGTVIVIKVALVF